MSKKSTRPVLVTSGIRSIGAKKTITPPNASLVVKEDLPDPNNERMHRAMTSAAIASNSTIRTISHILQNGTRMAGHPHVDFAAHHGLLIQLHNATLLKDKQEAEEQFLSTLQVYLEQAIGKIPGTGRKEDVPVMIDLLRLLIGEHKDENGFEQVANYLLRVANAPVDRF